MKWIYRGSALALVAIAIILAAYQVALHSPAAKLAKAFAESSIAIRSKTGTASKTTIRPLSLEYRDSATSGHAEFILDVIGAKATKPIFVTLEKANGVWSVSSATLDGQAVPVANTGATDARGLPAAFTPAP